MELDSVQLEIGALALGSATGLLLKSGRVVPARLAAAGFEFRPGTWPEAARDLVRRARAASPAGSGRR